MPDPTGSVENGGCGVADTTSHASIPAEDVVLFYSNQSGTDIKIALFDWTRHAQHRKGLWRYLPSPRDGSQKIFEDFGTGSNGWFSVYVVEGQASISKCLATANIFVSAKPQIVIKKVKKERKKENQNHSLPHKRKIC